MIYLTDESNDITTSVIVAFDYKESADKALLLVGKQNPGKGVQVINAFDGEEAKELWKKLTSKEVDIHG